MESIFSWPTTLGHATSPGVWLIFSSVTPMEKRSFFPYRYQLKIASSLLGVRLFFPSPCWGCVCFELVQVLCMLLVSVSSYVLFKIIFLKDSFTYFMYECSNYMHAHMQEDIRTHYRL